MRAEAGFGRRHEWRIKKFRKRATSRLGGEIAGEVEKGETNTGRKEKKSREQI